MNLINRTKLILMVIALMAIAFNGCKKDQITQPKTKASNRLKSTYAIGNNLDNAGIVAYILQPGDDGYIENTDYQKGFIVSSSNDANYVPWYSSSEFNYDANKTGIGGGYPNTVNTCTNGGSGSYAPFICFNKVIGKYNDWYLPSKDELNAIYTNRALIGGFQGEQFWTSSRVNQSSVYYQSFNTGTSGQMNQISQLCVRAIHQFPASGIIFNDNSSTVFYGAEKDQDGNYFRTVKIGGKTWMAENLRVTKYIDGTPIPKYIYGQWDNLTTPARGWYYDDGATYGNTYGALYNWYTVNTGKLAPQGWHVATRTEWLQLISSCGGANVAGGRLKETGISHWTYPNTGATNTYGFSAMPGGVYIGSLGESAYWWTSTASGSQSWVFGIDYNGSYVGQGPYPRTDGFSVRCVKN